MRAFFSCTKCQREGAIFNAQAERAKRTANAWYE